MGPAEVVHHKGSIVWFYTNGNLQKVAGYKVKPYELVLRDDDKNDTDDTNNDAGTDKNGTDDTNNEESNIEDEEIMDIDKLEDLNAAMLRNYKINSDDTKNRFNIEKDALGAKNLYKNTKHTHKEERSMFL